MGPIGGTGGPPSGSIQIQPHCRRNDMKLPIVMITTRELLTFDSI